MLRGYGKKRPDFENWEYTYFPDLEKCFFLLADCLGEYEFKLNRRNANTLNRFVQFIYTNSSKQITIKEKHPEEVEKVYKSYLKCLM